MAKAVSIIVTGDKELNKALLTLTRAEGKKAITRASRVALKGLLPAVKEETPKKEGSLRRSMTIRAVPRSRTRVGAMITTRDGLFAGKTFYGGFIEWGWKRGKRGIPNRKKIPGRHMMKRTADRRRGSVLSVYRQQCRLEIEAIVRARVKHVA